MIKKWFLVLLGAVLGMCAAQAQERQLGVSYGETTRRSSPSNILYKAWSYTLNTNHAFGSTWNASLDVPTKDSVYDALVGNIDGTARISVNKNSGATVGTRRRINLIEGANVTLTVADDSGNEEVDVTIAAAGGSSGDPVLIDGSAVGDAAGVDFLGGVGIDFTFSSGASPDTASLAFDPTEINSVTWGDNSTSPITWTYNGGTGTDPVMTFGNGLISITTGGLAVSALTPSRGVYATTGGQLISTGSSLMQYGGGGAGVTYVVASSTTAILGDYTCDGTADEVQINAALAALPAIGGTVLLTDGTYTIADYITMPNNSRLVTVPGTKIIVVSTYTPTVKTLQNVTVKPIITNSDHSNGNTNITVIGPGLLTMRGTTQIDTKSYAGIWFNKVTNAVIDQVEVSHILEGVTANGGSQATNRFYGIFFSETADSKINRVQVHDTGDDCINITRSSARNIVMGSRMHASTWGHSIQISGDANLIFGGNAPIGNIIANNLCSSNLLAYTQGGITIHGGTDNTAIGNTVVKSGYGIALVGNARRNVVSANAIGDVYNNGIMVKSDVTGTSGLTDSIITGNAIQMNSSTTNGILIWAETLPITNVLISANTIIGANANQQNGIFIQPNTHDIELVQILNNTVSGVGQAGVYLETTSGTTDATRIDVKGNTFTDSGAGVFINNAGAAIIRKGIISGNYIESGRTYGAGAVAAGGIQINTADSFYVANNRAIVTGRAFSETGTANTNTWAWNDGTGSGNEVVALRGSQSAGMTPNPLTLLDGDIDNPFTTLIAQTNAYFAVQPLSSTLGGARVTGLSDGDSYGLSLRGLMGSTDPTDGLAAIFFQGGKLSGTTIGALGAAEMVFGFYNSGTALLTILGNGDATMTGALAVTGAITQGGTAVTLQSRALTIAGTTFDLVSSAGSQTLAADRTWTLSLDRTATLAGNPALAASYAAFATTGLLFEGSTADTIETLVVAEDPTSTDKTITLPNATGTVMLKDTTDTMTGKTLDASASGNVLKYKSYLYLRGFDNATGALPTNTNDFTQVTFMQPMFSNSADQSANYIEWHIQVPDDIDTAAELRAKVIFRLGNTDTATHRYVVSMQSVADSAAYAGTVGTAINMDFAGDGSGASADVEKVGFTTLTGWAAAVTAGNHWVIRLARDGNASEDASTVDSMFSQLTLEFGVTQ